jgi:hypothetical protein
VISHYRPMAGGASEEFVWVALPPPGTPGTSRAPRHRLWVVGACEPGVVVVAAVVLGTIPAGAVVVGTPTGAVVVSAGPDGEVVDVPGARVAGGIDRSPPATTTPTDVLAPGRGPLPNKLASGCLATASTTVIAATAIPKASTARDRDPLPPDRPGICLARAFLPGIFLARARLADQGAPRHSVGGRERVGVQGFGRGYEDAHERRADEGSFDPEE